MKSVEQLAADRVERARAYILAHPAFFAACGTVVADWRRRGQQRFGPYFRLAFRQSGRQRSLYLGKSARRAQEIRRLLDRLQHLRHARRTSRRLRAQLKYALRRQKDRLRKELHARGFSLIRFPIQSRAVRISKSACFPVG